MTIIFFLLLSVDSLSLNQVVEIALERSPSYLESKEVLAKSRIQYYKALSYLLPTTSATGAWTHSEFKNIPTDRYTGAINFSIPLFDLDIVSSIILAKGQVKNTTIQHQQEIASLILSLKKSFYNLVTAQELLRSSEKTLERATENMKLVQTKFDLGSASKLELLQAEAFYLQSQQNISQARTLEVVAQQELRSMLNYDRIIYASDSFLMPDTFSLPSLDSLREVLKVANLAVKIAKQTSDLSKVNLYFSTLAFLPKVSFFYGYNTAVDSFIFDFQYWSDNTSKNYGINVQLPIFELKTLIFDYLAARKEVKIRHFDSQKVMLESEKALYTSYFGLQESITKMQFAAKSFEVAEEAISLAHEQYNLGAISILDLLRAEEEYYNAHVSLIRALNDFYVSRATLSYLLGKTTIEE